MSPAVRNFVEVYAKKPARTITVLEWMKPSNHEIWKECPKCSNFDDLRKTRFCTVCGTQLDPNFK